MYSIVGTTISLTRGDTFRAIISVFNPDGSDYIPVEGDSIMFAMKTSYDDETPLVAKDIPLDTMELVLEPEDTKKLDYGTYVYDVQLTKADGDVDTFITKSKLKLTEEVC